MTAMNLIPILEIGDAVMLIGDQPLESVDSYKVFPCFYQIQGKNVIRGAFIAYTSAYSAIP